MNRKQLEDGLRCNKTNYTFARDQLAINQHLCRMLSEVKPVVDCHNVNHFKRQRFSNFDSKISKINHRDYEVSFTTRLASNSNSPKKTVLPPDQ